MESLLEKIRVVCDNSELNTQSVVVYPNAHKWLLETHNELEKFIYDCMVLKHGEDINVVTSINILHSKSLNGVPLGGYPELTVVIVVSEVE